MKSLEALRGTTIALGDHARCQKLGIKFFSGVLDVCAEACGGVKNSTPGCDAHGGPWDTNRTLGPFSAHRGPDFFEFIGCGLN